MPRQLGVSLVAIVTNRRLICFFIVTASALCGSISGRGLAFQVSKLVTFVSISFGSLIIQGTQRSVDPFFSSYGYFCVWMVWNERNNIQTTTEQLLEKVKFHSFWWLKANNATFVYDSHT